VDSLAQREKEMTEVALITTSINIPRVLSLYRAFDTTFLPVPTLPTKFFIAADEKTPLEAYEFCAGLDNCEIYSPDRQKELGYESSPLIGWNCVQRRNIVLLEALKAGADIIVTVDDDNAPIERDYFMRMRRALMNPFAGLEAGHDFSFGWTDPGQWSFPRDGIDPVVQRGFPQSCLGSAQLRSITGGRVGVAQGVILGDPDTSAIDRISRQPVVHQVSELLRAGVVIRKKTWVPFNTQNTAFLRQFAPAMFCSPHMGRYDDIFASLLTQRVMWERGYQVHVGQPFVWQERNDHNLLKDLADEQWGAERILDYATYLAHTPIEGNHSVVEDCSDLMMNCPIFSDDLKEVAAAWYRDCEKVL
jgi:hypothetical protein